MYLFPCFPQDKSVFTGSWFLPERPSPYRCQHCPTSSPRDRPWNNQHLAPHCSKKGGDMNLCSHSNWSWPLRQVFIRNESKTPWFHGVCLQNKADSPTSLLGQNKGSPNATQRTKGCRCSDEHSGISNKGCLLEMLTNVHLATATLTLRRKVQQLNRWQSFFISVPDITALSFPMVALEPLWPVFSPCLRHWCCACPWETPPRLHEV